MYIYREMYTQKCTEKSFKVEKWTAVNLTLKYTVLCQNALFPTGLSSD